MGLAAVAWGSWIHESSCSGSPRMDSEFQGLRHGNGAFQVTLSDEQTQVATLEGDDLPGSVEDNSTKLHSTITGASFRISVFEQMPATLLIKGSLLNKSLSASRLLGRGGEKERDGGILWKGARGAQVGVAVDGTPASSSWKCPLLLVFNASGSCVDLFVRALVACAAVHATATSLPFPRGEGQTLEHMDVQRDYVLIGPSRRKHMPRNFSQINLSTRLVLLDGGRIIHLTKYRMMVISNMRLLKHLLCRFLKHWQGLR